MGPFGGQVFDKIDQPVDGGGIAAAVGVLGEADQPITNHQWAGGITWSSSGFIGWAACGLRRQW
jgi:hypothetical protein